MKKIKVSEKKAPKVKELKQKSQKLCKKDDKSLKCSENITACSGFCTASEYVKKLANEIQELVDYIKNRQAINKELTNHAVVDLLLALAKTIAFADAGKNFLSALGYLAFNLFEDSKDHFEFHLAHDKKSGKMQSEKKTESETKKAKKKA